MACVKFLLLALAYMCSNEVKQRCILQLQCSEEHYHSRRSHKHRRPRVQELQQSDEHYHSGRGHKHRLFCVRVLQQSEKHYASGQYNEHRQSCILQLLPGDDHLHRNDGAVENDQSAGRARTIRAYREVQKRDDHALNVHIIHCRTDTRR